MSDLELYSAFLNTHIAALSRFAEQGFLTHGRGAVLVDASEAADIAAGRSTEFRVTYLHAAGEYLKARGGWPTGDAEHYVAGYDPETELVVLVDAGPAGVLPYWLTRE